ncbi:MAG: tetratricopeptide repeat protein [Deltaproteobacteria bacterium]|nr:tetratricopeptide repeat protein [Deltaproteobacteria bacterium]
MFSLWLVAGPAPASAPASQPSAAPAPGSNEWKVAYLLSRGWQAFSNHRNAEAEQLFKSVLKTAPTNEIALIHLAVINNERGDREAAAGYLRTAVKANPASFAAQFHLGATWLALKRYEEAAAAFNAAARADPKSIDARVNLGDAYELFGRGDDAKKAYQAALAIDPKSGWAHRQLGYSALKAKDAATAAQHLTLARATFPKDADLALNLGHAQSSLGNDAAALEAYQFAVTLRPNASSGYVFVGSVFERMGKKVQAEKTYKQAVRVTPNDPLARTLLGNLMRLDGRTVQARKEYEAALRANKDFVWALTELGSLLFERGDTVQSAKLLKRALQLAPNNDDIEIALGDIDSLKKRYDEAAARYRRVLARSPLNLAAMVKLGYMLRAKNRLQDAQKIFERAVAQFPKSAWALISLGDCERMLRRYERAEAFYRRALDVDPKSTWARRQLGYVLFELHKPLQAREALLLVEAAYPTEAEIPLTLGHVARILQEHDAAKDYYEKAAKLAPKNPLAPMFLGVLEQEQKHYPLAIDAYARATKVDPKLVEAWVLRGDAASLERNIALSPLPPVAASQPASMASSLPASLPSSIPGAPPAPLDDKPRDPALAEKMYEIAKDAYRKALDINPNAGWPSRQLGFLEFYHERLEQARPLLIAASKDFPEDVEIQLARGHIERAMKHDPEAIAFFEKAAALAPNDVRGHVFLAILLRDQKRFGESFARATMGIAADNTSAWAYYERALTAFEMKRHKRALNDAERATKLDWKTRGAWLLVGRLRHEKKDYDEAINAYGIAMTLGPNDPDVQLAYASALRDRGRYGDLLEAAERVEQAVQALKDVAFAHLVAGHVFARVADVEQKEKDKVKGIADVMLGDDVGLPFVDVAARHLARAVELAPENAAMRISAARSLVGLKRPSEARTVVEPLLELGKPECPEEEWNVSWRIEKNRAELLPGTDTDRWKNASDADYVSIAYLLAGDLALEAKSWKQARLLYACAVVHQPNRPESHLRLGAAHEADGFVRLAEEHFVVARLLSDLALARAAKQKEELDDDLPASLPIAAASQPASLAASAPASEPIAASEPVSQPASDRVIIASAGAPPAAAPEPEIDEERKKELVGINVAAAEAVGRLRKEGGFPVAKILRLSGETSYRSQNQALDLVQRSAEILDFGNQTSGAPSNPLLVFTVPRTFATRAVAALHKPEWRAVPRFELEYKFFHEENAFVSDPQLLFQLNGTLAATTSPALQNRLGHFVEVRAAGTLPLRVPSFELAYTVAQAFTYATSPLRDEFHGTTTLTLKATVTQIGSAFLQLGYDPGAFIAKAAGTSLVAHTFFSLVRVEPMLRKQKLDTALEYRVDATWLTGLGRAWNHALEGELGSRLGNWYVQEKIRFGFAASDLVPTALPTIFSYLFKTRGGYVFGQHGSVFGSFTIAGTGAPPSFSPGMRTFDYVAVGAEGHYRLLWPKISGVTHTGFQFTASYDLRIAYNVGRLDHVVSAGVSFAR